MTVTVPKSDGKRLAKSQLRVGVVFVIGVGSPLLMIVLMVVWAVFKESRPFFRGESLNEDTEVLVPEDHQLVVLSVDEVAPS